MIPSETKQESSTSVEAKNFKASSSSTSSWSRLKDPRIVRVSRALGGKDRHSKVCTVRGLRDRRVRLSVPTAIQLYDLQDRLGLNQPSKVVDWLLNAAKHEIDELPPLRIPPGSFNPSLLPMLNSNEIRVSESEKQGLKIGGSINWENPLEHTRSNVSEGKSKDASMRTSDRDENWARSEKERQFNSENHDNAFVSADNFPASRQNPSTLPTNVPYNSFFRWDPSNLNLSHHPRSQGLPPHQPEDWHNFSLIPLQPTVSVPSGSNQVLAFQPGISTQSHFPSQIGVLNREFDPKQLNFQIAQLSTSPLSSPVDTTTPPVRTVHFNMTANLLPSQHNDGS